MLRASSSPSSTSRCIATRSPSFSRSASSLQPSKAQPHACQWRLQVVGHGGRIWVRSAIISRTRSCIRLNAAAACRTSVGPFVASGG